jgi:hypothetical protein
LPGENGRTWSKDSLLSVYLEVRNLDDGRKLDYRTFAGGAFERGAGLSDDLGNRYKGVDFGFSATPEGSTPSESIYPGKAVADHVVFEPPVGKASFLTLESPASYAGLKEGVFRFKIPTRAVEVPRPAL